MASSARARNAPPMPRARAPEPWTTLARACSVELVLRQRSRRRAGRLRRLAAALARHTAQPRTPVAGRTLTGRNKRSPERSIDRRHRRGSISLRDGWHRSRAWARTWGSPPRPLSSPCCAGRRRAPPLRLRPRRLRSTRTGSPIRAGAVLLDCYPTNPRGYFDVDLHDPATFERYRALGLSRLDEAAATDALRGRAPLQRAAVPRARDRAAPPGRPARGRHRRFLHGGDGGQGGGHLPARAPSPPRRRARSPAVGRS